MVRPLRGATKQKKHIFLWFYVFFSFINIYVFKQEKSEMNDFEERKKFGSKEKYLK